MRVTVASTLAHPDELTRTPTPHRDSGDPRVRACVLFAEQFVVDVSGTTDEQRASLGAAMGDDDLRVRAGALRRRRVPARSHRARADLRRAVRRGHRRRVAGDLWPTLEEFMRVVALGSALDPITTELVRLRGARAHNCRVCQSRLSLKAVDAAGDASDLRRRRRRRPRSNVSGPPSP